MHTLIKTHMNHTIITSILTGTLIHTAIAAPEVVLWSDNFNAPNNTDFDTAPLAERLSGTLAAETRLYEQNANPEINGNKLLFTNGGSRVQFRSLDGSTWYDWAASTEATAILAAGGFKVEFDFTPANNSSDTWVAFNIGVRDQTTTPGTLVNDPKTDYGILFRNDGRSERWDNLANLGAGAKTVLTATRHVVIEYSFSSFADGTSVQTVTTVNGEAMADDTFTWDGNSNIVYMELDSISVGARIDDFKVSTLTDGATLTIKQDDDVFPSGVVEGGLVSQLSATSDGVNEVSTFVLEAGAGDTDNGKFEIDGDRLEAGTHDFTQDSNGTQYFVRIKGTGNTSGGTQTKEFTLNLIKDDDADTLLDEWELSFAEDLTILNGLASGSGSGAESGDFDGDSMSDFDEYTYSLTHTPSISPLLADTDDDGLNDNHEINPISARAATNPTVADTDKDGLSDLVETNTGSYISPTATGTSGMLADTDEDGSRDGFEVEKGSSPTDFDSRPALPPAFAFVRVTNDASTGISDTAIYTHKISGGDAATVNGVTFDKLDGSNTPLNFVWTRSIGGVGVISNTLSEWKPDLGEVTGTGALELLGGFVYDTTPEASLQGSFQTYTLSGLTVGEAYTLKIFVRPWGVPGARAIDLEFTNGDSVVTPFGAFLEDQTGAMLNNGNENSAYYLSYTYVAESTDLVIKGTVHQSVTDPGSFHLYGLTNEVAEAPSGVLAVTGVSRLPSGAVIIDFIGSPVTDYKVTKSPDLVVPFGPLTSALTVTTNAAGVGKATVPATEASEAKEFYRIEE